MTQLAFHGVLAASTHWMELLVPGSLKKKGHSFEVKDVPLHSGHLESDPF